MKTFTVRDQSGQEFQVDENKIPQAEKDGFLPVVTNGKETYRVAYNDLPKASRDGFRAFDVSDYSPENIEATKQGKADEAKSIGSSIMENIVDPVLTGIDYTYAPIRQAAAAPAKIARGDFVGAILDPITQLAKSPKTAPTSEQVAEMYGIPKEKKVAPIAVSNPLMASTYELNPDQEDTETETTYPAAQAGALMDTALGGVGLSAAGKGLEKVSKGVSSGARKLAEMSSPARSKAQTDAIIEAANRLGIKVTPAMLDDTKFVQRLEYTLANSPSILGQSVARKQEGVFRGMQKATEGLTSEASTLSPNEIGEKFKYGINASVAERLDPIVETFDEIAKNTKASKISQNSKDAIIRNILNIDDYRLTAGAGRPSQYVEMLGRAENANDVKKIISYINDDLRTVSGPEKFVLTQMKTKLMNLEKNSVTRAAIKTARDLGMKDEAGRKLGAELINDLKGARKGYRDLSTDIKSVSESARLKTGGPMDALDKIENIPSENIQAKFFNVGNNRQLTALKEKFPEQFELLRQGKLKDIAEKAIDFSLKGKGEASTTRFLKEIRELNPEAKKMLFGKNTQVIDDLKTIQSSLPENFNPSGTANQLGWQDVLGKNVKDIPTYLVYRGATSNLGKKISQNAKKAVVSATKIPEIPASLKDSPKITGGVSALINESISGRKLMSASNEKGEKKWMNTGINRLMDHDSAKELNDPDVFAQLLRSKKGQQLLIEASELKPGSKAMDNVMKKIRTGFLQKGDQ